MYSQDDLTDDEVLGFRVIMSEDYQDGLPGVLETMGRRIGDGPVHVSIDIDVLDPAHAPGTGTPEAGGLTSRELLLRLRSLASRQIVGADIVEVSPAYDHAQMTGIAAAHVGYELIALMAAEGLPRALWGAMGNQLSRRTGMSTGTICLVVRSVGPSIIEINQMALGDRVIMAGRWVGRPRALRMPWTDRRLHSRRPRVAAGQPLELNSIRTDPGDHEKCT